MGKSKPKKSDQVPQTFEEALARLEEIVGELEDGGAPLSRALAEYEEGVRLLRHCHGLLEGAQRRIELLTAVDEEGRPLAEPFDDDASHEEGSEWEEKSRERSRRRTRTKKKARRSPPPDDTTGGAEMDAEGGLF